MTKNAVSNLCVTHLHFSYSSFKKGSHARLHFMNSSFTIGGTFRISYKGDDVIFLSATIRKDEHILRTNSLDSVFSFALETCRVFQAI